MKIPVKLFFKLEWTTVGFKLLNLVQPTGYERKSLWPRI